MDYPLYCIPEHVESRWASWENPDSAKGAGGKLNFGRKGAPCLDLEPGATVRLAHWEDGPGTVRRFWITMGDRSPEAMRGVILRFWWDGADKPAVEAPIGDFCGMSLGREFPFQSAWFDNPEGRSFNCRIPMPFRKGFRFEVTNDCSKKIAGFFYDVNFTVGDQHGPEVGYFHAHFRRENPTTMREDFEILPAIQGKGRYLGCTLGVRSNMADYGKMWWGEGEVKVYLDGDKEYPTLCGTGTEDYIATAWGQGQYDCLWHGCPLADHEKMEYSFYRLHGPDPIYFHKDIRVTIQQLGCYEKGMLQEFWKANPGKKFILGGDGTQEMTPEKLETAGQYGLFEREDDWSSVVYFYLDRPESSLPAIAPYAERVAGLVEEKA